MSPIISLIHSNMRPPIEQLLNSFNVEVVHLEKAKLGRPFMERYNEQLSIMEKNMQINSKQ